MKVENRVLTSYLLQEIDAIIMNNTYGTVKPSLITDISQDVEIWYKYKPTRSTEDDTYRTFKKVANPTSMLSIATIEETDSEESTDLRLPGMYELALPVSIFGNVGIYTVYIKPREIPCTIRDIGALAAFPDVKGIVIDLNSVTNRAMFSNDNLTGYRIEYYDYSENGLQRQEYYRIITSNNNCEPVSQNLTSANTNSNGYRFNDSGTLSFITVTPSTSMSFRSNQKPYIGSPNQKIMITNTKFDPVMLEIEMVEHDIETVSTMLEGDQIRSLDKGLLTTYNKNGEIYIQSEYYTIKNTFNNSDVYEVRKKITENFNTEADYEELVANQ